MNRLPQMGRPISLGIVFLVGCGVPGSALPPPIPQTEPAGHEARPVGRTEAPGIPVKPVIERIAAKSLPNAVRVHQKVISGGLPEGDDAFGELAQMGIKTIISVDGARPNLTMARTHGLRYVHLPHGYDGVPRERGRELARAIRDLPGPIYVHCHHGKHRSPAAASVACIGAGFISHDEARKVLAVAGTGENYIGLFQSVDRAEQIPSEELSQIADEFPEVATLPAMAEAMVAVEHIFDHLKLIEKRGWNSPAQQPALAAAHDALLLREQFTEMLRTDEAKQRPEEFQQFLQDSEKLALSLEMITTADLVDRDTASKILSEIGANCKRCHQAFRDKPSK